LFLFGFILTGVGPTPEVGPIGMGVMLVILFFVIFDVGLHSCPRLL
jgi:hypothetical protein